MSRLAHDGGAIEEGHHPDTDVNETGSISKDGESNEGGDAIDYTQAQAPPTTNLNKAVGIYAAAPPRPPVDYSSFGTFCSSSWIRFKSLWTKRFTWALIAGQVLSLCITCTNVTTTELAMRGWNIPTTQTFFLYFSIFIVYTPYTIYQYGWKGWGNLVIRDGWKYIILAAADVEGNYLVVKAYQYTTLLSCMLLDALAIPSCIIFSWIFMRPKIAFSQLVGIIICIGGLGMLVASDHITDKDYPAVDKVKGDIFMIFGALLYGFDNAYEEWRVRDRPLYEVVGQLGMWGVLINGLQAAGLEHKGIKEAVWDGATVGLLIAYTAAMFILYTVAPILYRLASSPYYNLSLLSSDFFGLLFGLFLYNYSPYWLYFPAFAVVIVGLVIYFWTSKPEEQGSLDPQRPSYVQKPEKTRGADLEASTLTEVSK